MKIVIVGSSYVGLVSGACFAELGNQVVCVDADPRKIAGLRQGQLPIYEPGLGELVASNVSANRLEFSENLSPHVADADLVFITVGTPPRAIDGEADLSAVFSVARETAKTLAKGAIVVTKSTVPVGTGEAIERVIRDLRPGLKFAVVSNPEFLREGSALEDFMRPDRIVVGSDVVWARERLSELYAPLVLAGSPILHTGRNASEVIKYAANAFLATKISFINEISDFCEATKADIAEVARGIGLDRRIGASFLQAGPGYGGSCFPKDTQALLSIARNFSVNLRVVESTISVNEARKRAMAGRVVNALDGDIRGKSVAVLGLTFKPNTDDMREAPSLSLISLLQQAGAKIRAYDPIGMDHARAMMVDVEFCPDAYSCLSGADVAVLMTEWDELCGLDLTRGGALMRKKVMVDLRNALDSDDLARAGFETFGVGRLAAHRKLKEASARPVIHVDERRPNGFASLPIAGVAGGSDLANETGGR